MIEIIIKDYLKESLGRPCYMEMPKNPEEEFVLIEKTGSSLEDHITSAVVAIQSYGVSKFGAAELNEKVKCAMLCMAELDEICKVSLNSDYPFDDTSTKRYRYQAVFDVKYY